MKNTQRLDSFLFTRTFFVVVVGLFGLLLFSTSVFADTINVNVDERGKIISYYDEYYVYQLEGNLSIQNPSNTTIYNIELPLYVSTLDVRTNYSTEGNYMTPSKVFLYALGPNSTYTFNYRLVGISTEDLSENNESVLANGIKKLQPKLYSNLFGTLKKAPLEDVSLGGKANTRLISVEIKNPTGFIYHIDKILVIKTSDLDPTNELQRWDFTAEKDLIGAYSGWAYDFLDQNATEGQVYWLSTDIYIDQIDISDSSNITRFTQEDLFEVIGTNQTLNETVNESVPLLSDRVYLRKFVSKTLMTPGEVVEFTLLVNNLETKKVDVTVTDPLPYGFSIQSIESAGVFSNQTVSWNLSLSSGTAKRLKYKAVYDDTDLLGVDYFRPGEVGYDGETYYSQSIPFVRKYVPEQRVFVQKNVKFLSDDEARVTITVQNLGESELTNILVKEHLLTTAEFREISQTPMERGLWKIEQLGQSETWETTYVTDKESVLNTVPEIYGVEQGAVLQTLILSNVITSRFSEIPTSFIEIFGVIALVIIVGLYFTPTSFFARKSRSQKKELSVISREIHQLKEQTDFHNEHLKSSSQTVGGGHTKKEDAPRLVKKPSSLQSPERIARHNAVEEVGQKLAETVVHLTGKPPEKPKVLQQEEDAKKEAEGQKPDANKK